MPTTRLGGAFKLTLLFALEVGFVVIFHLLGNVENMGVDFANFTQWMHTTPPEVALVASIRILALAFSYWLLGTSLIYMIARALNLRSVLRGLEFITIPGVRRVIDAGVAATIIGGTVFGGASAVFAQSSHQAQTNAAPAAVTATYKDLRVLYNPTPAGDEVTTTSAVDAVEATPEVVSDVVASPEVVIQSPGEDPIISPDDSVSTVKVVVSATDTDPAPGTGNPYTPGAPKIPVVTTTTPAPVVTPTVQDPETAIGATDGPVIGPLGNYIPDPAGGSTPTDTPDTPQETTTTTTPKVVVTAPPDDTPEPTVATTPKVTVPTTTKPVTTPTVSVEGKQVEKPSDSPAPVTTTAPTTYTVVAGDNFWNIAKSHLASSLGHEPTDAEVASYWVKLIDANKSAIRSGDPDLIFPGEVFTFPPL